MYDNEASFTVDDRHFDLTGIETEYISAYVERFVNLVRKIKDDGGSVAQWTDIYSTKVLPNIDLNALLYAPAHRNILDDTMRQALMVTLNSTLERDGQENDWNDEIKLIATREGKATALSCAKAQVGNGVACIQLGLPNQTKKQQIRVSDSILSIQIITDEKYLRYFYRDMIKFEDLSEARFHSASLLAFPSLILVESETKFNRFEHPYSITRDKVVEHLSAINDYFASISNDCSHHAPCITALMSATHNVDMSKESPKTHANENAMKDRDVIFHGMTFRCEWHSKLFPTTDRIHFNPSKLDTTGGKILIGLFARHLST